MSHLHNVRLSNLGRPRTFNPTMWGDSVTKQFNHTLTDHGFSLADFNDHEMRSEIQNELHARLVQPLSASTRVRRIVFWIDSQNNQMAEVSSELVTWSEQELEQSPNAGWRQFSFQTEERLVTWEMHTEFLTLTWHAPIADQIAHPNGIGLEVLKQYPILSASRVDLIHADEISASALQGFEPKSMCLTRVGKGKAQIGTDFQTDKNGFTRFEVAASGLSDTKLGVLVRRLLEINTYRSAALLGLFDARAQSKTIGSLERELNDLTKGIGSIAAIEGNQAMLQRLHDLSVRTDQCLEETSYRFAASQAYGDVLKIRLERIEEDKSETHTSITRYLSNRIEPALATCRAVEKRQRTLSDKIAQSIQLLDARINVDIQSQNKSVLTSISKTAKSQYRLQSTVEGLSTIAISYYALGIIGYVISGFVNYLPVSKNLALAMIAPLVLFASWSGIRMIKNRHKAD